MEAAPVEYMIVAFPGNRFRGEIAPALKELVDSGTIKIIDLTFVGKDEDGSVVTFEVADLDPDVQEALESLGAEVSGLFNEEDLMAAAEELEPNTSAALLVWRTSGPAGSRRRSGTPAVSSSTSAACPTRWCRRHATGPPQTAERTEERNATNRT
jgi:hypothetical protein